MKKLNSLSRLLFFLGYFLVVFPDLMGRMAWLDEYMKVVDIVSILFLFGSVICALVLEGKKVKPISFSLLASFFILVVVNGVISAHFMKLPVLLMAALFMDFDKIIKFDLGARSCLLLVALVTTLFGINGDTILEYRDGFMRNSFGLGHPNIFAFALTVLCADLLYLFSIEKRKRYFLPIMIVLGINLFNVLLLGSRTNIIVTMMLLGAYLLRDKIHIGSRIVRVFLQSTFIVCLLLSLVCVYAYGVGAPFAQRLNEATSGRVYYGSYFVTKYGVSAFGQNINDAAPLDNAYLMMLLWYGAIITAYFAVLYFLSIKRLLANQYYCLVLFSIIFFLFGLSEAAMFSSGRNPYVILLAYPFVSSGHFLPNNLKKGHKRDS